MRSLFLVLAFLPGLASADVVRCKSEIWSPEECAPLIESFKKDPYPYLSHITKTVAAAKVAIVSGANRGLVPTWNDKFWNVMMRADELSGFLEAQGEDPRRVSVKDPGSNQIEETSVYSGCYFLRDLVIEKDVATCESFLAPAARLFYLGMSSYEALCGATDEAPQCEALAPFYK